MKTAPATSPAAQTLCLSDWLQAQVHQPQSKADIADLQRLACQHLQISRAQLLAHPQQPLSATQHQALSTQARRLHSGEPYAYLVGSREFWSLELAVTPAVLIPRPDTETLVEQALTLITQDTQRVLELGTGSGAISIALAHELKGKRPSTPIEFTATDISAAALAVAQTNAQTHNVTVNFVQANWLAGITGTFGLIVSNPPYVATNDPHLANLGFEPAQALVAGADGLLDIKQICEQARTHLSPQGWLLLEHGYDQDQAVRQQMSRLGYNNVHTVPDLAGHPRVSLAQRP